ncbi:hypothetical protein [Scytonema hofmannii]|uniref:hypothetical protein n=1 Tax=Scytonema hofmannii TaxID=34078 RepID=UPI00034AFC52|nr:hypothetical protein [Scytonema hofmannii]
MSVRYEVPIICVREERVVSALLVTLTQKHLDDFGTFWKERLRASTAEARFWD